MVKNKKSLIEHFDYFIIRVSRWRQWQDFILLTSCCLIMVVSAGVAYSFGTLFIDIMSTFSSSRAETSVIQSTLISVFLLSGVLTGILIKKFGFVTIGVIGSILSSFSLMACFFASSLTFVILFVGIFNGIGLSFAYICTSDVINRCCSRNRRILIMSIHGTSIGVASMIYPYLLRYLSDLYDWRGALLLVGAMNLNAIPCCIVWKQFTSWKTGSNHENNTTSIAEFQLSMKVKTEISDDAISIAKTVHTEPTVSNLMFAMQFPVLKGEANTRSVTVRNAETQQSNTCKADSIILNHIKSVLSNIPFMLLVVGTILTMPTFNVVLIFVGDNYSDNGLTGDDLSFGLFLLSIFNIFGRLLTGILLQSRLVPTLCVPLFVSVASAVLFFVFTVIKTRSSILASTALFGMPMGVFASMFTVMTLKLVDSTLLPLAVGICFTLSGIGNLVYVPVNGHIRDNTGSYVATFYAGMAIHLMATCVFYLAHITRRRKKKGKKNAAVFYITNL